MTAGPVHADYAARRPQARGPRQRPLAAQRRHPAAGRPAAGQGVVMTRLHVPRCSPTRLAARPTRSASSRTVRRFRCPGGSLSRPPPGFSETVFVEGGTPARIRLYAPAAELPFAGYALGRPYDGFIERGHADYSIRAAVSATDCHRLQSDHPQPHGFDWPPMAGRQRAIIVNGLAGSTHSSRLTWRGLPGGLEPVPHPRRASARAAKVRSGESSLASAPRAKGGRHGLAGACGGRRQSPTT
jgi:hypothetical protein